MFQEVDEYIRLLKQKLIGLHLKQGVSVPEAISQANITLDPILSELNKALKDLTNLNDSIN